MAAASPFPDNVIDCPRCCCLCVGPTILPCGHITCRRCLRQLLEQQGPDATCSFCGHSIPKGQGQTISEQLDRFCRDLVLQEVVADHIFRRCNPSCEACCKPTWTNICLDCGTFYCRGCSEDHRTEHAAECHAVVDPRQVLISASSTASRPPARENVLQANASLLEFQRQEVKLLEEKHADQGQAESDLNELISKLQSERDTVRDNKFLLHMYTTRMPTTINTTSMRERLRRVREDISLPTREMLKDLRHEKNRSAALWGVPECIPIAIGNKMSTDTHENNVPPEYRLNIDVTYARDVIVCREHVEVHVWKKQKSCHDKCATVPEEVNTERVVITPESTTINVDLGPVSVNQITGEDIRRAVQEVVIAKIDWAEDLSRVQGLKREKQRLVRQLKQERIRCQQQLEAEKVRGQQLEAEKVKGQQLEAEKVKGQQQLEAEKVRGQQLEAEKRRAEAKLATLYHIHREEKTREREKVKRFYIGIQQKKSSLLKNVLERIEEKGVLSKLVQELCEEFDVRLLAVDSGLRFLMDVPVEEWEGVKKLQEKLRKLLEDALLSKHERKEVTWTEMTSCGSEVGGADVTLGQPLPTHVSTDSQKQKEAGASEKANRERIKEATSVCGVSSDLMTATPCNVFLFEPHSESAGETRSPGPYISAIIATRDGQRLVMTDYRNNMVKVADVKIPHTVLSVRLCDKPYRLALLHDGRVAATAWKKHLYLVDISGHPTVVSQVQTARQYWGVGAGAKDETLLVSCFIDSDGPNRVDVISCDGSIIRTVVDGNTLWDLTRPSYLTVVGEDILLSDSSENTVFRVAVATGRVVDKLTHQDLKSPSQACADPSGNIFITCIDSQCVMVMSADGRWRRLLEGQQHGHGPRVHPFCVCVMDSRLVVSWEDVEGWDYSVLAGYDLTNATDVLAGYDLTNTTDDFKKPKSSFSFFRLFKKRVL